MPARCLLYYITDRTAFAPDEPTRRRRLLKKIAEAARAGVDYIQLREKDLPARELELLAREVVHTVREAQSPTTSVLINARIDVAIAVGADGVHLRSDDILPQEVRAIWKNSHAGTAASRKNSHVGTAALGKNSHVGTAALGCPAAQSAAMTADQSLLPVPLIGVSCHSPAEMKQAELNQATFAVFAPVFEKKDAPATHPVGLTLLQEACHAKIPVLALGGITFENASQCLEAGAVGIAAIRLFQENDIDEIVRALRNPS
jgi:thiamine-phosphate pyrophosphorylase